MHFEEAMIGPIRIQKYNLNGGKMKKCLLSIVFVLFLMGMPLLAYADNNGNRGGNGNHWGWGRGGGHGVPDPATTLSLLSIGVAGVGAYSIFRKGKRK